VQPKKANKNLGGSKSYQEQIAAAFRQGSGNKLLLG